MQRGVVVEGVVVETCSRRHRPPRFAMTPCTRAGGLRVRVAEYAEDLLHQSEDMCTSQRHVHRKRPSHCIHLRMHGCMHARVQVCIDACLHLTCVQSLCRPWCIVSYMHARVCTPPTVVAQNHMIALSTLSVEWHKATVLPCESRNMRSEASWSGVP